MGLVIKQFFSVEKIIAAIKKITADDGKNKLLIIVLYFDHFIQVVCNEF
jgi:hypothetical protein